MEIQGKWTRDAEGFMDFDTPGVQRLYETITDKYHQVYNHYLQAAQDDEETAYQQALSAGYEMINDYKLINGTEEFVTTYLTPTHVVDVWYGQDAFTGKRLYHQGYIRISDNSR